MTFTKERLIEQARENVKALKMAAVQNAFKDIRPAIELDLHLAEIALAALTAEPYGYVHKTVYEDGGCCGLSNDHEAHHNSQTHIAVYTAPPAPVVPVAPDENGMLPCPFCGGKCDAKGWAGNSPGGVLTHGPECEDCGSTADSAENWNRRAAMLQGAEPVQEWIPCSERMPEEIGRYWCYVEEQNDLGKSHYQWNCSWNGDRWWVESDNGGRVTHWMPLPAAPQQEAE